MMSAEEFAEILPEIRKITPFIYLHVKGEPLTHPQFGRIMDLCDLYEMKVQLVTNGTLLSRYPDLYLHPSLRKISFSLQSVEFHHDHNIEAYMQRIIKFVETSSALGHPYCEIRFWRTDQKDMPATSRCMQMLKERYTFEDSGRRCSMKILDGVYVSSDNMFEWPSLSVENSSYGTCRGGIDQIAVLSDGTVIPCCLDNDGVINLGNIFKQPLADILKSERYLSLCDGFRKRLISEPLCRSCTFRLRFTPEPNSKH